MHILLTFTIRLIPALLLAAAGSAAASDYTYAMASNDSVYAASGAGVNESAGSSSGSSGGSIEGMDSRYLVSDEDNVGRSTPAQTESAGATSQPTISGGGNSASDRRATHRWQSLVPGAIK